MVSQIKYVNRETKKIEIENPPGESFLKFLYHNPLGILPLHLLVKRKFLSSFYGYLMNKKKSKNQIISFVQEYNINMNESKKQINQFKSFNDFFSRKLKPNSRKIEKGITSCADGKILAFEDISDLNRFFVKGQRFTLRCFLENKKLAKKFRNSSLLLIRLAPNDYHRFHFPYDGKTSKSYKIKGKYFSVSPFAITNNFAKIFCENKREYMILETKDKGNILISPVGATMVGSIIQTYKSNSEVKKGDEMGYFAFGGSSVLMLIDKDKIKIDKDLLENTKRGLETKISLGERIGI